MPQEAYDGAREAVRRGFTSIKWGSLKPDRLRENEAGAISYATEMMAAARKGAGQDTKIFVSGIWGNH